MTTVRYTCCQSVSFSLSSREGMGCHDDDDDVILSCASSVDLSLLAVALVVALATSSEDDDDDEKLLLVDETDDENIDSCLWRWLTLSCCCSCLELSVLKHMVAIGDSADDDTVE